MFKLNKNLVLIIIAAAGILITTGVIFLVQEPGQTSSNKNNISTLSKEEVSQKVIDYLNNNLLGGKATASILNTTEENGLVKMKLKIDNDEFDGYATLDAKLFFPQAFKLDEATNQGSTGSTEPTPEEKQKSCEEMTKTNKPLLEAFVVSECPYGLQMQRILAEIVKNIPSLAENIKVTYIGSISDGKITSMHGDAEAQEKLRQIFGTKVKVNSNKEGKGEVVIEYYSYIDLERLIELCMLIKK